MVVHEKVESRLEKTQSNHLFWWNADREIITIGSFLAYRFGLRICMGGDFFEKVQKLVGKMCQKIQFWGWIGSRWVGLGHRGVKNDRTGSGKAMETLPGPKTAIKNSKIQKMLENSKIGNFVFSRGRASYFPGGGLPIFPGRRPGRSPIKSGKGPWPKP